MVEMSRDEKSQKAEPAAADAPDENELFTTVERGSTEELLDAGAQSDLDAMRDRAGH
jgi:hypothetical protein